MKGNMIKDIQNNKTTVTISEDQLEAYLYLYPPANKKEYTEHDIIKKLNKHHVIFGIDLEKIKEIIENKLYYEPIRIAKGIKPQDGRDGFFEFLFERNFDKKPKILEDGSVDYLSIRYMESVTAGIVIVQYHPAIHGENGRNVIGKTLKCIKGIDLPLLKGKGFHLSEDKMTYIASIDGKVEYSNDELIVSDFLEVQNVDLSTGNIEFSGDILIKGNIDPGLTVKSSGTIMVYGEVEAAKIYAGKDVILQNGMQGAKKGIIEAGGNVSGKFFEQVIIRAKGSVNANSIMKCSIESGDFVNVSGKLGIIVGGITIAQKGVSAMVIGNTSEVRTIIKVGSTKDFQKELINMEQTINEKLLIMKKVENAIKMILEYKNKNTENKSLQNRSFQDINIEHKIMELNKLVENDEVIKKQYTKLIRTRKLLMKEIGEELEKKKILTEKYQNLMNTKIVVKKMIYPGTKVTINTKVKHVTGIYSNIIIMQKKNDICIFHNK